MHTKIKRTAVLAIAGWCLCVLPGVSQEKLQIAVKPPNAEPAREKDPSEERFPGGAALKTDPELQRLVARSDQFVKENRHDLAAVLWQKVLDEAGDSLMTRDGRVYTSIRDDVEQTLAKLPKIALMTYRITADGEAQAVISRGEGGEEAALHEVVRRFFLSTQGDDAAYRLACLALDRHDFVGAARMLQKILSNYPDPSVPRGELLLRLALAGSKLGDSKTADTALAELHKLEGGKPSSLLIAAVVDNLKTADLALAQADGATWPTTLGNPQRTGRMPSLSREITGKTMSELWVEESPLQVSIQMPQNMNGAVVFLGGMGRMSRRQIQEEKTPERTSREQVISQWRSNAWMPTSQLLFDGGQVYTKTCDDLAAFNVNAPTKHTWRTVWANRYELDGYTSMMAQYRMQMGLGVGGNDSRPRSPLEILLFGDNIQAAMSISDGLIFSIEGQRIPKQGTVPPSVPKVNARPYQHGVAARRARQNWLACYESKSGKNKWHRPAGDEEKESSDTGFLNAPVPYGESLLVPVTEGGTIWLYALARDDGRTLWKSYLCDEPVGSCSPWSPVGVSVDGSEAYVVSGTGVVFAVDAGSGAIHWAVRYTRDPKDGKAARVMNVYGGQNFPQEFNGWREDTAVVQGRALLVMASDSDKVVALDRRNGNLLWESPRTSPFGNVASYCVGVVDRGLIVAGKDIVRRYDIPTGRMVWDMELDGSYGRGAVTADAVYIPVKDSILVLDAATGKEISQVGVKLTTGDPVGNIYSDGDKLWVSAPGRLFTLTNLDHRLAMLEKQIAAGDTTALLNRMRLFAKSDKFEPAVADLLAAYRAIRKTGNEEGAQEALFDALVELKMSQRLPRTALDVLAQVYVTESIPLSPSHLSRRRDLIATALGALRDKPESGGAESILKVVSLLDQDYLLGHASTAVAACAAEADKVRLWEVLERQEPRGSAVALTSLAKLAPAELLPKLADLRKAKDERLRIAAARVALNLGERGGLNDFVDMLMSEEQPIRLRSYQSLRAASGQVFPFNPSDSVENRKKQLEQWQKWVADNGGKADLKLPLAETDLPLGRTLFSFRNQVVEVDDSRTNRWSKQLVNAWVCQGLPNGNRLVGLYGQGGGTQNQIVELNEAGETVGKPLQLPAGPLGLQRLPNGNTVVACTDAGQVLEYTSDGEIAWQITIEGRPMGIHRLENGNTLIALSQGQRVVEVDREKKTVWEVRNVQGPSSVQRLENGNTLIAEMFIGRVVEYDPKGLKTVWKKEGLNNPRDARRLPNGNTLIAENNGVQEIDSQGQTKWRLPGNGASSISVY